MLDNKTFSILEDGKWKSYDNIQYVEHLFVEIITQTLMYYKFVKTPKNRLITIITRVVHKRSEQIFVHFQNPQSFAAINFSCLPPLTR
jgi:hypothetical protein